MLGFSYWSHDIGGFERAADADVYKRWLQFGLLSTHSRLHGSKSYRVPWLLRRRICGSVQRVYETQIEADAIHLQYGGGVTQNGNSCDAANDPGI